MKFRYIVIDEFENLHGTNDYDAAMGAFESGDLVIDAQAGTAFGEADEGESIRQVLIEELS